MCFLVNIDVDNFDYGIVFYICVFGLYLGCCFGVDGVELLGGFVLVYLLVKFVGSVFMLQVCDCWDYCWYWMLLYLDWVVDDVDVVFICVVQVGVCVEQVLVMYVWGWIVLLVDFFGYGFCLLQFLGDGYDVISIG